jgi:transcriptional regulator with GAF, ATPase, and Fis domain
VLITGESETGKEIFSRLIHFNSTRSDNRLVTVNCSAITASLAESEFFGHVKGSFTGAISDKKGFFEQANNGTLYLDEIGDMPMEIQAKLLRAIESGTISPVGSDREIDVDVRIVASTNKDLDRLIQKNLFRLDLLHRINAIHIVVPPLRERGEDIILLIDHYVKKLSKSMKKKDIIIDASYIEELRRYNFPGNIRELRNVIERSMILETSDTLSANSLPHKNIEIHEKTATHETFNLAEIEKQTVLAAYKAAKNSQKDAAKLVGLSPSAFSRKLKKVLGE